MKPRLQKEEKMPTKTGIEIEKKFGSSKYSKDSFDAWSM